MSAQVRKFINPWNIALVTLLVGLVLGYQVNDVTSSGKINSLQETIDDQSTIISSLEQQVAILEGNYTTIQSNLTQIMELYEFLQDNAVMRTIYDELLDDYEDATQELEDATERLSVLEEQVVVLEDEYEELQESYFKLWNMYNEIRVLSWTYFVVNGLEVNLTTLTTEYDTNYGINGTMSIHYISGEPFNGTFKLKVWSDFYTLGSPSEEFEIYGEVDYFFKNPFVAGPGAYDLSISTIEDNEGNVVASIADLRDYVIKLQLG